MTHLPVAALELLRRSALWPGQSSGGLSDQGHRRAGDRDVGGEPAVRGRRSSPCSSTRASIRLRRRYAGNRRVTSRPQRSRRRSRLCWRRGLTTCPERSVSSSSPPSVIGLAFALDRGSRSLSRTPCASVVAWGTEGCWIASNSSRSRSADAVDDLVYLFRNLMIKDANVRAPSSSERGRSSTSDFVEMGRTGEPRARPRNRNSRRSSGITSSRPLRYRRQLGQLDEAARYIAIRAMAKLGAAGRRAFARGDLPQPPACFGARLRSSSPMTSTAPAADRPRGGPGRGWGIRGGDRDPRLATRAATDLQDDRLAARSVVASTAIRLLSEESSPASSTP